LWQPLDARGFEVIREAGAPVWHQLTTRDYHAAIGFYREVFGWRTEQLSDTNEFRYTTGWFGDLPADYVAENVTLGYASTIDLAQGLTAKFACHIVGVATLTRQLLYVALTPAQMLRVATSTAMVRSARIGTPSAARTITSIGVESIWRSTTR